MTRIPSSNPAEQRGKLIKLLETALSLADDLEDGATAYQIERALDEARIAVVHTEGVSWIVDHRR